MAQIRVLHVLNELNIGGIQSFIMNVYRNIDRDKIQFDFLLSSFKVGAYEDEIEKLGGNVYRVTGRKKSVFKNISDIKNFFEVHSNYDCIHCHFSNLSYITPLVFGKMANIPIRIIHSHSTNLPNNPIHKILHNINKRRIYSLATNFFTCSDLAGEWLFGGTKGQEEMIIVNNGIEIKKYMYDERISSEYKQQLNLEDKKVFGCVGMYCEAKNHSFALSVFSEIKRERNDVVLLMAGIDESNDQINKMLDDFNIRDSVMLLGIRKDIPQLLQCFDCFLMPSKWEGFPVSLLEAQASGVSCYVSNTITKQAKINENVVYLDLSEGAEKWATKILDDIDNWERNVRVADIVDAGFDINNTVQFLEKIYSRSSRR